MAVMTYLEASRQALIEEMRRDALVWAVGEDLGRGGVFGQYRGLTEEFGADRIADAPISEACIMGAATGAAMMGSRPIVEMRFSDFALCATDELVNQAAKARYMFGGQARVPLVVRQPIGLWRSSAAQHSQSLESWYAHIPGLVVICPSTPEDNKGLLKSAIRCDDPVVYLEHKGLWTLEGEVPDGDQTTPIGKAKVIRPGKDITLVSWSATVHVAVQAAAQLAESGIDVEIIDLRTLWPWDKATVFESVEKTGRLVVAHEAVSVAGFGAEIIASVCESMHHRLTAPPARVAAPRIPIGYAPSLEDEARVTPRRLIDTIERLRSLPDLSKGARGGQQAPNRTRPEEDEMKDEMPK